MDLIYHSTTLPTEGREDLRLTAYVAEPGTPSEDALKLLASWAATDAPAREAAPDRS